jgi:hypothetical protein
MREKAGYQQLANRAAQNPPLTAVKAGSDGEYVALFACSPTKTW